MMSASHFREHKTEVQDNYPITGLDIDPRAQRACPKSRVSALAKTWDTAASGVITISRREDGREFVVDGQARVSAARKLGIEALRAEIHHGLTVEEEARLFLLLNRDKKNVTAVERFLVGVTAADPIYVRVQNVLNRRGLTVGRAGPDRIQAVRAITYVVSTYSDRALEMALYAAEMAWGRDARTWDSMVIGGLGRFFFYHADEIDLDVFIKRLTRQGDTNKIVGSIVSVSGRGNTGPKAAYLVFLNIYNKGRRTGNLEPR